MDQAADHHEKLHPSQAPRSSKAASIFSKPFPITISGLNDHLKFGLHLYTSLYLLSISRLNGIGLFKGSSGDSRQSPLGRLPVVNSRDTSARISSARMQCWY